MFLVAFVVRLRYRLTGRADLDYGKGRLYPAGKAAHAPMTDPPADSPLALASLPSRRRRLFGIGLAAGILLLCGLLAAWSLVEVIAHDRGESWDPPPLHTPAPSATLT